MTVYGYDGLGRRLAETGTDTVAGTVGTTEWTYDEIDQVTETAYPEVTNVLTGATT